MSSLASFMYLYSLFKMLLLLVVKRYNLTVLGFVEHYLGKNCSRKCCRARHSSIK